jgi:hypothetical protein
MELCGEIMVYIQNCALFVGVPKELRICLDRGRGKFRTVCGAEPSDLQGNSFRISRRHVFANFPDHRLICLT